MGSGVHRQLPGLDYCNAALYGIVLSTTAVSAELQQPG